MGAEELNHVESKRFYCKPKEAADGFLEDAWVQKWGAPLLIILNHF